MKFKLFAPGACFSYGYDKNSLYLTVSAKALNDDKSFPTMDRT